LLLLSRPFSPRQRRTSNGPYNPTLGAPF